VNQYEVIAKVMETVRQTDWGAVSMESSSEEIKLILRHDNRPENIGHV